MATTEQLLSLQRKIALDSYHQTTQAKKQQRRSNNLLRPRSLSGADANNKTLKPSKSNKSNKSNKSHHRSKDKKDKKEKKETMSKPFKNLFSRPKPEISDNNYNSSNVKKLKNMKKLIDKKLLVEYRQYIEERVEMLRCRAFPNEVIYQLPSYRTDLTRSLNKSIPYLNNIYYSRHKECDKLIQADLLKAEKHALEHTTKLHKKKSKFKSITEQFVAPIKPIKNLFVASNKPKIEQKQTTVDSPITHLSSENYTHTNMRTQTFNEGKSNNILYENENENENEVNINAEILSPNSNLEHKFNIFSAQNSGSDSNGNENENDNEIAIPNRESTASTTVSNHTNNTNTNKNEPSDTSHATNVSISTMNEAMANQLISTLSQHILQPNKMEVIQDENEPTNELQIANNLEITPFPNCARKSANINEATPENIAMDSYIEQALPRAHTMSIDNNNNNNNSLIRSKTFANDGTNNYNNKLRLRNKKHNRSTSDPSPTPPFFTVRTNNIRSETENIFDRIPNLRSNTPSWALRDSSVEMPMNENEMNEINAINQQEKYDMLQSKYNELELLCSDLQIIVRTMQQNLDEQNNRMDAMENELEKVKSDMEINNNNENIVSEDMKLSEGEKDKKDNNMWHKFKEKIQVLEDNDIISFERSTWENMYHSLFSYFMNGLMVIFNILTQSWMLIGFLFRFLMCCFCKNNDNNKVYNNMSKNNNNTLLNHLGHNHTVIKRRNKKKRNRMRRGNNSRNNNNIWSENSDENDIDSQCFD